MILAALFIAPAGMAAAQGTTPIPERWLLIFPHDHHVPATHVAVKDKGRPIATRD